MGEAADIHACVACEQHLPPAAKRSSSILVLRLDAAGHVMTMQAALVSGTQASTSQPFVPLCKPAVICLAPVQTYQICCQT